MSDAYCSCSTSIPLNTGAAQTTNHLVPIDTTGAAPAPCPSCGYCPTCGRKYRDYYWDYWRYPHWVPFYPTWVNNGTSPQPPNQYTHVNLNAANGAAYQGQDCWYLTITC